MSKLHYSDCSYFLHYYHVVTCLPHHCSLCLLHDSQCHVYHDTHYQRYPGNVVTRKKTRLSWLFQNKSRCIEEEPHVRYVDHYPTMATQPMEINENIYLQQQNYSSSRWREHKSPKSTYGSMDTSASLRKFHRIPTTQGIEEW